MPPPALVRAELARVLASPQFDAALNSQRLLRYLVEHTLAGNAERLKETVLGLEVFRRPMRRYDPSRDSIVRVEVRRLRQRLARFAEADGTDAPLRFLLPVGQYRPLFDWHPAPAAGAVPVLRNPFDNAAELSEHGEFFLRLGHDEGCRKALLRFEEAVRLAPEFAPAHLGIARAWSTLADKNCAPPMPAAALAQAACERTLALEADNAQALSLLGRLRYRYAADWQGAQTLLRRAVVLAPRLVLPQRELALGLMSRGRFHEAGAALRQARTLEPRSLGLRTLEVLPHLFQHEFDAAERKLRALLELRPHGLALHLLAYVLFLRGDLGGAFERYRELQTQNPQHHAGSLGVAMAQALGGMREAARSTTERVLAARGPHYVSPYQLAQIRLRLGETLRALDLLEQAAAEHDPCYIWLPVDPGFDALRSHPRFRDLLECFRLRADEVGRDA